MRILQLIILVLIIAYSQNHAFALGDCDNDGMVSIAEVQSAIRMFLEANQPTPCVNGDLSGRVSISDVQKVIITFLGLIQANTMPISNAGKNQNVTEGTLVILDGSASSDANNDSLTYSWKFISRPVSSLAHLSDNTAVKPEFTPDLPGTYVLSLTVNDGKVNSTETSVTIIVTLSDTASSTAIIDDYVGVSLPDREWYFSRIDSDRGKMGDGDYLVDSGGGKATVTVKSGWGGVWTSLKYNAETYEGLDPKKILGPYIHAKYQPYVKGIQLHILDGQGKIKIELKNVGQNTLVSKTFTLSGGKSTLTLESEPSEKLKFLNWLVDGPGNAVVDRVSLLFSGPKLSTRESVFLYSYAHLSQCYDEATGLVRDRANRPVVDSASIQTIGTFALATAVAWKRGFVDEATARKIVLKTRDTLLGLPKYRGLFPHFMTKGEMTPDTEWSSIDTVIALFSEILACQSMGEDTTGLENLVRNIDWADLTDNGTRSISHGYDYAKAKLAARWDTFGSESFLLAVAYASATGNSNLLLEGNSKTPTSDGSGFNDEMAALFLPMAGTDKWGNNWQTYRDSAFQKQFSFITEQKYKQPGLFGLSAAEVPEPWSVAKGKEYSTCGVGGHNSTPNDGVSLIGYPIIAPHYAAMVSAEHPAEFEKVFSYLITHDLFTPLNNVESFGIDSADKIHWNSLKGSWNLSLQTLGAGRLIQGSVYLPHDALKLNSFIKQGFSKILLLQ